MLSCAPGDSALSRLYIEGNRILPEGLEALAQGIALSTTLKELDLRGCEIGDPYDPSQFDTMKGTVEGAFQALSDALCENKRNCDAISATGDFEDVNCVEALDLQDNIISSTSAEHLEAMFQNGAGVSTLKIDISTPKYEVLYRVAAAGKGGKKGKKGKKKK